MKITVILVLMFIGSQAFAQQPARTYFDQCFGQCFTTSIVAHGDGYLMAIREWANGKYGRSHLIKINANGQKLWRTKVGLNNMFVNVKDIVVDGDGNIVLASEIGIPDDSTGGGAIIKLDPCGNEIWTTLLAQEDSKGFTRHVAALQDGNYLVSTRTHVVNLFKISSSSGEIIWKYTDYHNSITYLNLYKHDKLIFSGDIYTSDPEYPGPVKYIRTSVTVLDIFAGTPDATWVYGENEGIYSLRGEMIIDNCQCVLAYQRRKPDNTILFEIIGFDCNAGRVLWKNSFENKHDLTAPLSFHRKENNSTVMLSSLVEKQGSGYYQGYSLLKFKHGRELKEAFDSWKFILQDSSITVYDALETDDGQLIVVGGYHSTDNGDKRDFFMVHNSDLQPAELIGKHLPERICPDKQPVDTVVLHPKVYKVKLDSVYSWPRDSFRHIKPSLYALENVTVYPNPTTDRVCFKASYYTDIDWKLFDAEGAFIKAGTNLSNECAISLGLSQPGMYFLHASNGTDTKVFKIMKIK